MTTPDEQLLSQTTRLHGLVAELERQLSAATALGAFQAGLASGKAIADIVAENTRLKEERDRLARELSTVGDFVAESRLWGWRHTPQCKARQQCGPLTSPDVDNQQCTCYVLKLFRFEHDGTVPTVQP